MYGTILDSPLLVTDGKAKIGFPKPSYPKAAPRIKSICPPTPRTQNNKDYKRNFDKVKVTTCCMAACIHLQNVPREV